MQFLWWLQLIFAMQTHTHTHTTTIITTIGIWSWALLFWKMKGDEALAPNLIATKPQDFKWEPVPPFSLTDL